MRQRRRNAASACGCSSHPARLAVFSRPSGERARSTEWWRSTPIGARRWMKGPCSAFRRNERADRLAWAQAAPGGWDGSSAERSGVVADASRSHVPQRPTRFYENTIDLIALRCTGPAVSGGGIANDQIRYRSSFLISLDSVGGGSELSARRQVPARNTGAWHGSNRCARAQSPSRS